MTPHCRNRPRAPPWYSSGFIFQRSGVAQLSPVSCAFRQGKGFNANELMSLVLVGFVPRGHVPFREVSRMVLPIQLDVSVFELPFSI